MNRPVLITGCSTGIGRATATRLARKGLTVYATARTLSTIEALRGAGCQIRALDVCDESSMITVVNEIVAQHGAVGALVNNAGFGLEGPFEEVPMEDIRRQFETNVFGLVRLTQLVLPGMREHGHGRIVNIGSMGGRFSFPGGAYYHATKHALEALTDVLRFEVAGFGIGVSLIQPGVIATAFGSSALREIPEMGEGPYAAYKKNLFDRIYGSYEGRSAKGAAAPDAVAKVIERAISARRPRTRYRVTNMARALLVTKTLVPDRVWDRILLSRFPRP